jgi:hypothetical protein
VGVACELVVRAERDDAGELRLAARVVASEAGGARLELTDEGAALAHDLAALARLADAVAVRPRDDDVVGGGRAPARNVQERLRHLSLAEQVRLAQKGHLHERVVLERMYGKAVWEPLLRNPAVTGPEVARIARMGALPRPLVELIVDHGGWLQIPEIRRALLANPRLGTDQILRVLRLLPRRELELAARQTACSHAVRAAARRLMRDE